MMSKRFIGAFVPASWVITAIRYGSHWLPSLLLDMLNRNAEKCDYKQRLAKLNCAQRDMFQCQCVIKPSTSSPRYTKQTKRILPTKLNTSMPVKWFLACFPTISISRRPFSLFINMVFRKWYFAHAEIRKVGGDASVFTYMVSLMLFFEGIWSGSLISSEAIIPITLWHPNQIHIWVHVGSVVSSLSLFETSSTSNQHPWPIFNASQEQKFSPRRKLVWQVSVGVILLLSLKY